MGSGELGRTSGVGKKENSIFANKEPVKGKVHRTESLRAGSWNPFRMNICVERAMWITMVVVDWVWIEGF